MKRFFLLFLVVAFVLNVGKAQILRVDKTFKFATSGGPYVQLIKSAKDSASGINLGYTGTIAGVSYATSPLYPDSVRLVGYVTGDSTSWITIYSQVKWPGASAYTNTKWDTVGSASVAAVTYQKLLTSTYYSAAQLGVFGLQCTANSTGNAAVVATASKFYIVLQCFYKIPR